MTPAMSQAPETMAHTPVIQAPSAAFDVISIRRSKPDSNQSGIDADDLTFVATNVSIKTLLVQAYGIRGNRISGLPGWTDTARFDVNAKVVDPDVKMLKVIREQRRAMLVGMLMDRFHVKVHTEEKVLPVFFLIRTKNGPKFKESAAVESDGVTPGAPGTTIHSTIHSFEMTAHAVTLASVARSLSNQLDRNVIDETELTGTYDLQLKWSPEESAPLNADAGQSSISDAAAPSIFIALQDQLGLKLIPAKRPVPTLMVDHIEQPSEN